MRELVHYMAKGLVRHPEQVQVDEEVGEASILLELCLSSEDADLLESRDELLLGAMRRVLSAAAGRRKAVLELVTEDDESEEAGADGEGDSVSADLEESDDDASSEDGDDEGSTDDSTAP